MQLITIFHLHILLNLTLHLHNCETPILSSVRAVLLKNNITQVSLHRQKKYFKHWKRRTVIAFVKGIFAVLCYLKFSDLVQSS